VKIYYFVFVMSNTNYMKNVPALDGKTAIVTGTGGIGYAVAYALAGKGAAVILAGRNAAKGGEAVDKIKADFDGADVRFELLDLADAGSIEAFSGKMLGTLPALDILMDIAGVMMPDTLQTTTDGVEMQFGVNYLGHFALTARLVPLLKKSADPRVVTISSLANRPFVFDLADATAAHGYHASRSYALSKLACLMFALELEQRSRENSWGVSAFGAHPGLAKTQLFNRSHGFTMTLLQVIFFVLPFIRQSAANAARPALLAATSPAAKPGGFYGPWFLGVMGPPRRALVPGRARNKKLREELWILSEKLTGLTF
jgi:NAD(P)-dependent dehydrogenase (short-subunit alcohol dehydrogenase family)